MRVLVRVRVWLPVSAFALERLSAAGAAYAATVARPRMDSALRRERVSGRSYDLSCRLPSSTSAIWISPFAGPWLLTVSLKDANPEQPAGLAYHCLRPRAVRLWPPWSRGWGRLMKSLLVTLGLALAAAIGLGAGYLLWDTPKNWYAADVNKLGPGAENDLIRYGRDLIVDTARHIGVNAENPAMRYAGNDLACQSCHLNAGLQPFAAPFVSTFATFPMLVDDQVLTLHDRINGCMTRSMNGKALPDESREMEALIAYIRFVGKESPEGVRVAGMGLKPLRTPTEPPDARRGAEVYAKFCAECHKDDGQGERKTGSGVGYNIPPLWGEASFNAGAGMAKTAYAAAYIHDNMPYGIDYEEPVLSVQQAWDVAAYIISKPHPPAPPIAAPELQ